MTEFIDTRFENRVSLGILYDALDFVVLTGALSTVRVQSATSHRTLTRTVRTVQLSS